MMPNEYTHMLDVRTRGKELEFEAVCHAVARKMKALKTRNGKKDRTANK